MKYIFRTALLNRYSIQPVVSRQNLQDALKKAKYPKDDLDNILEKWNVVVDQLIKSSDRQQDKISSLIRQHYQYQLDQNQMKDIITIWLAQYQQVYSTKLKSFLPYNHLQGVQWSVNTTFMSKRMSKMSQSVAILNLRIRQPNGDQKMLPFQMDRNQLNRFYQQLAEIQQKIDQLLVVQQ